MLRACWVGWGTERWVHYLAVVRVERRCAPAVRVPCGPDSVEKYESAERTPPPLFRRCPPSRSFRLGRQEDSHEFLRCLLDGMHEACLRRFKPNKPPPELAHTTFVYRIFGGRLRSQVRVELSMMLVARSVRLEC